MTTVPGYTPSPEFRDSVLAALLTIKRERGMVPNADVRRAADLLGCTTRTVRNMIRRGAVTRPRKRTAWTPPPEYLDLLLRHDGSIALLRETLVAEGKEVVSARTMQRGFAQRFSTVEVAFARGGYDAARGLLPTNRQPDGAINDEWSMDDTLLPVWCVLPDGTIGKPYLQAIRDRRSRVITGFTISPHPFNTEDAVETLAAAMVGHYTDDGTFVGGKPRALRTDRGSNFISRATSLGLVAEDIARNYTEPYTPEQNGGIERWNRTYKAVFKGLPGYDWSDYKPGDRRKAHEPPPFDEVLLYEELVVEAHKRVRRYNHERVHSAHGMTPIECWERDVAADPDLIQPADPRAIRASMVQSIERKLKRRRITWNNHFYVLHPESVGETDPDPEVIAHRSRRIDAVEGKEVPVRFLHGRVEFVSVYTAQGEYLGDAVWDELQTAEQAAETARVRREHIKTLTTSMEKIAQSDAAAIAERRAEALAHEEAKAQAAREEDGFGADTRSRSNRPTSSKKNSTNPAQKARVDKARDQARADAEAAAKFTRKKSA